MKKEEKRSKLKGGGLMRIRRNLELRNEKNKKERKRNEYFKEMEQQRKEEIKK